MCLLSMYGQLNVVPNWLMARKNSVGLWTRFESRSLSASSPAGSSPRVERANAIAYGWPWTSTVPLIGPCTLCMNVSSWAGCPFPAPSSPASKCWSAMQCPLYR